LPNRRLGASRATTRRRVSGRGAHSLPSARCGTCQTAAWGRLAQLLAVESAAEALTLFRARGAALAKPPLGGVTSSYSCRVRCRGAHSLPSARCSTCHAAAWGRLAQLLAVESAAEAPTLFRACGTALAMPPLGGVSRSYSCKVRCRGAHSLPSARCGTCQTAAWGRLALLLAVESAAKAPTLFRRAARPLPNRRLGASRAATRRRVSGRGAHSLPSARCGTCHAAAWGRLAQLLA